LTDAGSRTARVLPIGHAGSAMAYSSTRSGANRMPVRRRKTLQA
jgi:hypothetical protein